MTKKTFIMAIMVAIIAAACGTVRIPGVPGVGGAGNVRARPTRTPAPTVGALDPSASTQVAFTPIPTYDVVSKLVTQAYALYTPTPGSAATKAPAATAVAPAAPSNTGAVDPAPASGRCDDHHRSIKCDRQRVGQLRQLHQHRDVQHQTNWRLHNADETESRYLFRVEVHQ